LVFEIEKCKHLFNRSDLGLEKSARYRKPRKNQEPKQGKTKHVGVLVFVWPGTPARY
jgi:hypothetical protein